MKLFMPHSASASLLLPHLRAAGITVDGENPIGCDLALCPSEDDIGEMTKAAAVGVPTQNTSLLNKTVLIQKFSEQGLPTLGMRRVRSLADLESMAGKPFILKPTIGMGSVTANPLGYRVFDTIASFQTAVASDCPDFWAMQNGATDDAALFVQESVTASTERPLLTILDGYVNGAGETVFLPVVENFQVNGQPIDTDTTPITAEDEAKLQNAMIAVLQAANIKNAFFMMQFIRRAGGQWYPVDFQYRLSYHTASALIRIHEDYCAALMKFAFDLGPKPQPVPNQMAHGRVLQYNSSSKQLASLCQQYQVWPVWSLGGDEHIYRRREITSALFNTFAPTKDLAKQKIDAFAQALAAL